MRRPRRSPFAWLPVVLLLGTASPAVAQAETSAYQELQTFSGVLNHIRLNHADTISYRRMVRAAIDGVLESLDPHSYFLSRADNVALGRLRLGDLAGVGIHLEPVGDDLVVRTLDRDGPAERGGLFPGDRLLSVNDTSVAGLDAPAAEALLVGKKGSKVRLRLARGPHFEPREFDVELARAIANLSAVSPPVPLDSETVYVRVVMFGQEAARDLEKTLGDAAKDGRRRVVLDMRGNPGGLVSEAVDMAALFLPKNVTVFSTRGRKRDVNVDYETDRNGPLRDLPVVILIDAGSASAAEAFAGALQDLDRAALVGRRSFGKALMQSPFFLPHGDIVWLTIGRVQTPSGRVIQRAYRGLNADQYRNFAGSDTAAEDSVETFRTARGRTVRGGGGIRPDVETPGPPEPPAWWSEAYERGWMESVADSAAASLSPAPAALATWIEDADAHQRVGEALLARVRAELGIRADAEPAMLASIRRTLAARVAAVRWGVDAGARFRVAVDPDVRAAVDVFPRLDRILAGSAPPDSP